MTSIQDIAAALRSIAKPGMKPKALRSAIREKYPDAGKKEIVRAAFYAVAEAGSFDEGVAPELHDFALAERISEDNADEVLRASKRKKKKHRSSDGRESRPTH